jgi:hypothetical protein
LFFFACPKKNQKRTLLQDVLAAQSTPMLHKFLLKLRFASRYSQNIVFKYILKQNKVSFAQSNALYATPDCLQQKGD